MVIPARNEAARVSEALASIPSRIDGCQEILRVVVDDGSDDDTSAVASRQAVVVRHAINLGKGAALRTGCEAALGVGCDLIAAMDADGQHRGDDLAALLRPLLDGDADVAIAYRSFSAAMPPVMRAGNWGLSLAFSLLYGPRFRDTQCGLRAFTAAAYDRLRWRSTDYSVETEMLIRTARCRLRVAEVPIQTVYHDHYKGTTIGDGVRIFANMLRWRLPEGR